jgi:hypothetical protein
MKSRAACAWALIEPAARATAKVSEIKGFWNTVGTSVLASGDNDGHGM